MKTLSDAAKDFLAQKRIAVVGVSRATNQPAMFCEPVDLGHTCFRWFLTLTGKLPAHVGA